MKSLEELISHLLEMNKDIHVDVSEVGFEKFVEYVKKHQEDYQELRTRRVIIHHNREMDNGEELFKIA